jgi:predicted transcriptional regulator
MKLEEIKNILQCQVLTPELDLNFQVDTVLASDGMSEILAFHRAGSLMITGLTNIQSVRTAYISDVRAIVYIRGKQPNEKTVDLARQKSIPILATSLGMFDVCGILREKGMKGAM